MSDLETGLAYQNGWIDGQRSAKGGGLYTRTDVEAAVKRALEGAGKYLDEMALQNGYTKTPRGRTAIFYARKVRALNPAQFVGRDKP